MKSPSVLLFDLGGVLIENSGFENLNHMLPQPLDDQIIRERWLRSASVRRFELGTITSQAFATEFITEWSIPLSPDEFLTEFASWPKGFYPGAKDLLQALRKDYTIACLSNSNELHWEKFDEFASDFDIALSSHLLGAIKPDQAAFSKALAECNSDPDDVYFFDDSISNVKAAELMGIPSFHVDGFGILHNLLETMALV